MKDAPRTVLIVDDDPQVLRLVEKMLKSRPVKILLAPRPSEALAICESQQVDLLISDVAMPEMDGNKLADRVLHAVSGGDGAADVGTLPRSAAGFGACAAFEKTVLPVGPGGTAACAAAVAGR